MNAPFSEQALKVLSDADANEKLMDFLQSSSASGKQDIEVGDEIYTIRKIGFKGTFNTKKAKSSK